MKVYIHKVKGQFSDDWLFAAYLGFRKKGAKIKFFEDIEEVPFALDNVVVTGVDESIRYFEKNNIPVPSPINIPQELNYSGYLGREIEIMTMKEFREKDNLPIFVKPHSRFKEFSSGPLYKESTKKLALSGVPDESLVLTSEVIEFLSEYRCFIYKEELVGIKHYQGDFTIYPDNYKIQEMINQYKNSPIAYTLDIGICLNDSTYLVEASDFWSIGHYGFDIQLYSSMLRDRWFEIVRQK